MNNNNQLFDGTSPAVYVDEEEVKLIRRGNNVAEGFSNVNNYNNNYNNNNNNSNNNYNDFYYILLGLQ